MLRPWEREGDVQDRAVLRDVDLLAAEHGVDPLTQTRFFGQLHEQRQGFVRDPVLGVVQIESHRLDRHPLAALGVVREQRPQMHIADRVKVIRQTFPCRTLRERVDRRRHVAILVCQSSVEVSCFLAWL